MRSIFYVMNNSDVCNSIERIVLLDFIHRLVSQKIETPDDE